VGFTKGRDLTGIGRGKLGCSRSSGPLFRRSADIDLRRVFAPRDPTRQILDRLRPTRAPDGITKNDRPNLAREKTNLWDSRYKPDRDILCFYTPRIARPLLKVYGRGPHRSNPSIKRLLSIGNRDIAVFPVPFFSPQNSLRIACTAPSLVNNKNGHSDLVLIG
jgi:hypothetical protein